MIWNPRSGLSDVDLAALVAACESTRARGAYCISDEPSPADHDEVAAFAARIKSPWGDSHYDSLVTGIGQASGFPGRREIENQRNAAIAGGHPDLILWFTLSQVIGWEAGQSPGMGRAPRPRHALRQQEERALCGQSDGAYRGGRQSVV